MKVLMRLERGKLVPPAELKFLPDVTEVEVEISNVVIQHPQSKARTQLDKILGSYAHQRPGVTSAKDKEIWQERL
ncbi:MAG: hypothetical protein HC851_05850 [Acaryochloris sp. RU_4_1]|nr:hypothetical protein [Acaryochloris sp. RU_4_1]NJR55597.1 hypothetical protein [Acaryochloris sp. CRU_2_0]